MRRLVGLLLLLSMIGIQAIPIMAKGGKNEGTENKVQSEESYMVIENCKVDCKKGEVHNLTKYLSEHLSLQGYTIGFEKIIPADWEGKKHWILYSISNEGKKTPYCIWVYSDENGLKYSTKWNTEKLTALSIDEVPFLPATLAIEAAREAAYIPFTENEVVQQKIAIKTDSSLRPTFGIMSSYREIGCTAEFAFYMQYVYDKDIIPKKTETWSPFSLIEKPFTFDMQTSDYSSIEKHLSESIPGFQDAGFQVETVVPSHGKDYFIHSRKYGGMGIRLNPRSYMVFGLQYKGLQTPYKVEVVIDENKMEYRYNFSPEDIAALVQNKFIKNAVLPEAEVQKAVEKCKEVTKEKFDDGKQEFGDEYEILSQEITRGLDEELRFYVDVKIAYKNVRQRYDDKIVVSSRYYISL